MKTILLAKSCLDGHDRGVRTVARALRDNGMEVILMRFETPEEVIKAAEQEDVDVVGISSSIGGHNYVLPEIVKGLKDKNMEDVKVIAGGVIPQYDIPGLLEKGVARVFGPGTPLDRIVDFINQTS